MKRGSVIVFLLCIIMGCHSSDENTAQGYVEGLLTYISSAANGYLDTIEVVRGNSVKTNQLLFTLNPEPESHAYQSSLADLKEAEANREVIIAKLTYAKATLARDKILYTKNDLQKASLDQAQSEVDSLIAQQAQAEADINQKKASVASSNWTLTQKKMMAGKNGIVFDVYYRIGEYVSAYQPVLSILAPEDIKIIFYIMQPKLSQIKLGDPVKVACTGCEWVNAKITFISPEAEYTPPLIFSNDTNTKLVYRIEAALTTKTSSLHPGQPVTVRYGRNR